MQIAARHESGNRMLEYLRDTDGDAIVSLIA